MKQPCVRVVPCATPTATHSPVPPFPPALQEAGFREARLAARVQQLEDDLRAALSQGEAERVQTRTGWERAEEELYTRHRNECVD